MRPILGGRGYRRKGKCLPKARMEAEAWGMSSFYLNHI